MTNITLKQLRYFTALAEIGHFGHAAARLSISQPALSVQIKELETQLGQPLVERAPKRAQLTSFGHDILRRAKAVLGEVDALGEFARASADPAHGRLRLGAIPTIAPYLLPRVLPALREHMPQMDLSLRETVTPQLLAELDNGTIDAALIALPANVEKYDLTILFEESMWLVKQGVYAAEAATTDLRGERLLLLEEGHCFRDQALAMCTISDNARHAELDGSSLSTLVQMVGAGFGVTLVPEMALDVETRSANVTVLPFKAPRPTRKVAMVWRRGTALAPHLTRVAEIVRDAAA